MHPRLLAAVAACALGASLLAGGSLSTATAAPGADKPQPSAAATARSAELAKVPSGQRSFLTKRFSRETARYGDQDYNPERMRHVRELQYRLRWAGVYKGPVIGQYGPKTKAAVKRFQKKAHLKRTGVADRKTWKKLIPATVRGRSHIPGACKTKGWHACYDRYRHQVSVFHDGKMMNSWLVRGGSRNNQTRTGDFKVFYRDKDHVSSLYGTAMPNSQFFSGGQAFHGSPFMVDPYVDHSHGCINMYLEDARQLWALTSRHPLSVHVRGRWS